MPLTTQVNQRVEMNSSGWLSIPFALSSWSEMASAIAYMNLREASAGRGPGFPWAAGNVPGCLTYGMSS